MPESDDFYFDAITQVKMNSWTKGRIALVGDAGYCPSPLSGQGKILGVRMPLEDEDEKPWEMPPSSKQLNIPIDQTLPQTITLVLSNQIFIPKQDLPPALITKLIRLAAFQNPEFYIAQAMRLSTFGKPRIIACAEDFSQHIGLPRGCLDECVALLTSLNIDVVIDDKKNKGKTLRSKFLGTLTAEQKKAAKALLHYDTGVLAATTAFGKTVVGVYMINKRKTNTLVIVHRRHLLDLPQAREGSIMTQLFLHVVHVEIELELELELL
jgi:hypothetical protein